MELLQLRYFCEVVKWGNITKAAQENYISQPALSKTIRNLEKELGTVLFDRVKNRVELNEYGQAFYEKVSKGLMLIDSGVEGLKSAPDSERGEITLIVKAGQYLFPGLYDTFCKQYPDIILNVANYSLMQRRLMTEYDFHISASMNNYPDIDSVNLMREEMVIIVNKDHPLHREHLIFFKDLEKESFVGSWRGSSINTLLMGLCHVSGFVPRFTSYYSELEGMFQAVANNEGIALVPYDSLKNIMEAYQDDVRVIYIADSGNFRYLKLCWPKRNFEGKRLRIFRMFATEYFANLEEELMKSKNCQFHNNCITHMEYALKYF